MRYKNVTLYILTCLINIGRFGINMLHIDHYIIILSMQEIYNNTSYILYKRTGCPVFGLGKQVSALIRSSRAAVLLLE